MVAEGYESHSPVRDELVKVVITTYNRRDWLIQALESVLAQTHAAVHIVVVDDGSTDGTVERLREYEATYPGKFTIVAKVSNRGVADSIRIGLEVGPSAQYVGFLNDDDLWPRSFSRAWDCAGFSKGAIGLLSGALRALVGLIERGRPAGWVWWGVIRPDAVVGGGFGAG